MGGVPTLPAFAGDCGCTCACGLGAGSLRAGGDAGAWGTVGPSRRVRASSIERPMFWMSERSCCALRVDRFECMFFS
jgi:hypothetical protein